MTTTTNASSSQTCFQVALDNTDDVWFSDTFWHKFLRIEFETKGLTQERDCHKSELWQVIADFDHTLTSPNSLQCHRIIIDHSPDSIAKPLDEVMKAGPSMSKESDYKFGALWTEFNREMQRTGFEKRMLYRVVRGAQMEMRGGAQDFFDFCEQCDMPLLIASAGIENIIEIVLDNFRLLRSNVSLFANRLFFEDDCDAGIGNHSLSTLHSDLSHVSSSDDLSTDDEFEEGSSERKAKGSDCGGAHDSVSKIVDFGPLIHSRSKHDLYGQCKDHFDHFRQRPFAFVMGDSLGDAAVVDAVHYVRETIKVGFFDRKRHRDADADRLQQYKQKFDVLIFDDNASLNLPLALLSCFTSSCTLKKTIFSCQRSDVFADKSPRIDSHSKDNTSLMDFVFGVD